MWKVELDWEKEVRPFKICEAIYLDTPFGQVHISRRVLATFDFKEATEKYLTDIVSKLNAEEKT